MCIRDSFQSSTALASAYGLAVTGTLLLTTLLFLVLAHYVWRVQPWKIGVVVVLVLALEAVFFGANMLKLFHGGWIPLVIAALVVTVMTTWRSGSAIIKRERAHIEGPLEDFIADVHAAEIPRVEGLAVFPHPDSLTTPLALRQNVAFNRVMHSNVVIVSIVNENVPHVRHVDRASVHDLGYADDGIFHITYRVGFNDSQDVPKALIWAQSKAPELDLDPDEARYFLSSLRLGRADVASLRTWRKALFPVSYTHLDVYKRQSLETSSPGAQTPKTPHSSPGFGSPTGSSAARVSVTDGSLAAADRGD